MKVKVIIFCILFAQTSASFFDEFRGAMSSVEHSFGRLVTDVVSDVRDTIGCTILAVKQVLSFGGLFHDSSEYERRCGGGSKTTNYVQETNDNYSPTQPVIGDRTPKSDATKKSVPEIISDQIDKSIVNINKTIDQIVKSDTHDKMVNVSNSLVHETNRLAIVSALLRREIGNISAEVKEELGKVETDNDNPKIQGIWNEIKSLHSMELSHKNTHESAVIHNILGEVLSVLRGYNSTNKTTQLASIEELNNTYMEIKNQFIKIENEESQDLDLGEDNIEENLVVARTDSRINLDDFPITFKGVAKKIMDDTSRTLRLEEDSKNNEELILETTESTPTSAIIEDDILESPDYADLFDIAPKDSISRKAAVESAKELIEKSKETDAIMDSYFKKTSEVGYDLFDSPDMFEFGF